LDDIAIKQTPKGVKSEIDGMKSTKGSLKAGLNWDAGKSRLQENLGIIRS